MPAVTLPDPAALWQTVWRAIWQPSVLPGLPWIAVAALVLAALLLVVVAALAWAVPRARRWWTDETPGPDEDERGVSTVELTLQEHLLELRSRLIVSVIALTVTTGIACVFYRTWFEIAIQPVVGRGSCAALRDSANHNVSMPTCLQAITPTELIFAFFQLALVVGLIAAVPVIAYQVWAYIAPGLTRKERRYVVAVVPGATFSFVLGVSFAYFALLPAALSFLFGFSGDLVEIRPTVASYISLVSRMLLAIGVIFELPLAMFFLSKLHLINPKMLGGIRRYVIVAAFIISAVVTPTPDPLNQLLVAVPILVLYEVGVLLA
ncbi:MAG TPA: twin-arginine translocase subunit TatC, partial [Chloroflexota bacterium]|nr:twin-arginine translocase subunit TatC [Chloroflexota bacterium]